jgi:putative endonuclease
MISPTENTPDRHPGSRKRSVGYPGSSKKAPKAQNILSLRHIFAGSRLFVGAETRLLGWDDGCGGFGFQEKSPAVYILATKRNGTLYVGVTSDFVGRISDHKQDLIDGFTKQYGVHLLVYIEMHDTMDAAIKREKQIKRWRREWKLALIEKDNPEWRDQYPELSGLTDPDQLKFKGA